MAEIKKRLGDILLEAGKINNVQLESALKIQATSSKRLGEILLDIGFLTEIEMIDTLSKQLSITKVDLEKIYIDPEVARCIPKNAAQKHILIPIYIKDNALVVAMNDPLNVNAIDDITFLTKKKIEPVITSKKSIERAIELYFNRQITDRAIEDLKKEYDDGDDKGNTELAEDIQNAPAVRLTNSIINNAIAVKASDIHIEPFENHVTVRYRVDGVLNENTRIPLYLYTSVSTRIKIMAGMNIAEKRLPQDGRVEMTVENKNYDFRVSSLPTIHGEKIVIRILDKSDTILRRDMLALTKHENTLIDKILNRPHGIVLLTGPTGSGKTTTLYTMLSEINKPDKNIVTIEDPVEYHMAGINQVLVNAKSGLTFAAGLRSILRQDPDIIMVGEIRDSETAQIAIRAAITGHLVLSTLHTNDAPGAIVRLVDMGVQPYLVADAIIGVIAQRLVRRLCIDCKEAYESDEIEMEILQIDKPIQLYRAEGCPICNNSGYRGRIPIHEVMLLEKAHRQLIEDGGNAEDLRSLAIEKGMMNLYESCKILVIDGTTSLTEMVKVVYARD